MTKIISPLHKCPVQAHAHQRDADEAGDALVLILESVSVCSFSSAHTSRHTRTLVYNQLIEVSLCTKSTSSVLKIRPRGQSAFQAV